jgi:dolichyl-phosphate-mannose--protein O-mannosyl transferase
MSIPDKRLVYVTLLGGLLGISGGLILLLATPALQVVLLSIMFIVGGEACFIVWGLNKTNDCENSRRPVKILFYLGLVSVVAAVAILFFRMYLEMYVIQIIAFGAILGLTLQWYNAGKIYHSTKKPFALVVLVLSISLLVLAVPFALHAPFFLETRTLLLALLCFAYALLVFLSFSMTLKIVNDYSK